MLEYAETKKGNTRKDNNATCFSLSSRKDVAKDQEAQQSYFTKTSTSKTRARPDVKV